VLVTLPGLGENDEPRRVWGYQPPPVEQPRVLSEPPPIPPPGPYAPPPQQSGPPALTYPEPSLSRPLASGQDAVWAAASVPPAAPPVDVDAVQATLQRSADRYDDMVPAGWQRALRAVTLGLLTPGSAAGVDSERELVAKVRARRREPSVTAFLAGKGGMGTTTVAAGVGLTLAALRNDTTALVDLHRGPALLGRRLAGRTAATLSQLADTPPDDDPPELLRVGGALAIVDAGAWHTPITVAQTGRALQLLRSAYSFTLADIGNDHGEAGQATLDKADGVVVVTTSSQDAVLSAHVALERIRTAAPQLLPRVTVALVSLSERQHRRTARRLRDQLRLAIHRIVPVPFDPMLAAGSAVDVTRLRPSTREAFVRLAAFVVDPVSPVDIPAQRFRAGSAQVTRP
jgi:MinD-like ATPase involved in chromosome partitioning or flagellar assembly